MTDKRRPALGRGMAALLSNAPEPGTSVVTPIAGRTLLSLPLETIERSPDQPRKRFEEEKLEELTASVREHGVVEPIVVRRAGGKYQIIAGERRWRAAQRAGLTAIPAVVREASDRQAFELALVENLQRTDLNPIEEAEAFEVLSEGMTQEEVAKRVGKDRSTVANALRLLRLPEEVRDRVRAGELDMGHARAILSLEHPEEMKKLAERAVREGLSVRATEALVREKTRKKAKEKQGPMVSESSLRDLGNRLQRRLGARARVVPKSAVAGRIELEYTSLDELDGILAKIGA